MSASTDLYYHYDDVGSAANQADTTMPFISGGTCCVCGKTASTHKLGGRWIHPRCFYEVKHLLELAEVEIPFIVTRKLLQPENLERAVVHFLAGDDEYEALKQRLNDEAMDEFVENHPVSWRKS